MKRQIMFFAALSVLTAAAGFIALGFGSVSISQYEIFNFFSGKDAASDNFQIIMKIRLPRVIFSLLVGGMLAVSGVMLQGIFKNPLVDPFITGISSGAALGASAAIIAGLSAIMFPAMAGAVITILLVYRISIIYGRVHLSNLLLTGVMAGSLLSGVILLLAAIFNRDIVKVMFWLMGDLSSIDISYLAFVLPAVIILLGAAMYFSNDLNILSTGEEEAKSVGVNTELIKTVYFIIAGLLTGAAVALSGVIGFVGLVVPHSIRFITGPDHRKLIPASFLAGGVFLLIADTIARTVFLPGEIPVGIVTSLIGAPVFIFLLSRRKGV
jgi:iron complex transport system permease protein